MKLLGELDVQLGEETITLKPTFKGLVATEELSGHSLSNLLKLFLSSKAGIRDVSAVIYGGMLGKNGDSRPKYSIDDIGERVLSSGYHDLVGPCLTLIGSAYSGKPIDEAIRLREKLKEKNASATEEKKTEEPPTT